MITVLLYFSKNTFFRQPVGLTLFKPSSGREKNKLIRLQQKLISRTVEMQ